MSKMRGLAQVVGFVTLGLLAVYGLLALVGGTTVFGLAVRADDETPHAQGGPAVVLGGTMPQTMNYQGFLRNPDGSLVTGRYTITASIYDLAAPSPDETPFYSTTVPNVTVRDGLFNIVLGDDPPLPAEAFADTPRYIGISLNEDPELIPRQRLHAVPWSLTATTLVENAPRQSVQGLESRGDVGVTGDLSATGKVSVGGDISVGGRTEVNGLSSTGDVTVTGDITFTGSLWGFDIGKNPIVVSDKCDDDEPDHNFTRYDLGPEWTQFCALGGVEIYETNPGAPWADAICDVYEDGGRWWLKAHAHCEGGGDLFEVRCKAWCLQGVAR